MFRQRCKLPGASQVAEEWALTRAEAARAKAAGDKARQKVAGQLIAGLKREIQQLGAPRAAWESGFGMGVWETVSFWADP